MRRNGVALAAAAVTAAVGWMGATVQADHGRPARPSKNRSFDHYFDTYPKAMNLAGEPAFQANQRDDAAALTTGSGGAPPAFVCLMRDRATSIRGIAQNSGDTW
jgi:hypothetical protein